MDKELIIQIIEKYLNEHFLIGDFENWLEENEELTLKDLGFEE